MADRLGSSADDRDAAAFVGRRHELARLTGLLDGASPAVVGYVHGPGGAGKSALLRAAGREAAARGWAVHHIDGRDIGPSAEALDEAVAAGGRRSPTLLLLDGLEAMDVLSSHIRDHLLGSLPTTTRVVLASRQRPDDGWRRSAWGAAMTVVALDPLSPAEADDLLTRRGVPDPERRDAIASWAAGLPLALAIGSEVIGSSALPVPDDLDVALASTLLDAVLAGEVGADDRDVLSVTAVAPRTDARLLAAVLPGLDADRAFAWLRDRSFTESSGPYVTLHERVAAALRAELRSRLPDHERDLRRRILEHLYQRVVLGEQWLAMELPLLVTDPAFRYGAGVAHTVVRTDRVREGDAEALRSAAVARGQRWSVTTERWFRDAPDHIVVLRVGDQVAGAGLCFTPDWSPPWAAEDPLAARWLAAIESGALPGDDVVFLRDAYDVHTPADASASEVVALGNVALLRRAGQANSRHFVVAVESGNPRMDAFLAAFGYEHHAELDHEEDGRLLQTFTVDHGPGGLAHTLRRAVLADLGVGAPDPVPPDLAAAEVVRAALRSFHDPLALSASPLARGGSAAERGESVRRLLRQAVEVAFGESDRERLNRLVVEQGYLDPDGGHTRAAQALHLSRTTYFRRLADATERVARAVVELKS